MKTSKISNSEIVNYYKPFSDFPPVVVEQTNYRISEIIRRNRAGEQVLGNKNLAFDYSNVDEVYDPEKINPFVDMGFDLDDVIRLAKENGKEVTDLQNRLGELNAALDKAKQEEAEQRAAAAAAPAERPAEAQKS